MNKFLATTALVAAMSFGAAAMAAPVLNADGEPLLSWTDLNGNAVIGTQADYNAALTSYAPGTAPTAPDVTDTTKYPGGATNTTYIADKNAYDLAKATYDAKVAFPQTANVTALNTTEAPLPSESVSLLSGILTDAAELSASLTNVSQNLNNVDGSINVDTLRDTGDFSAIIESLTGGGTTNFGSFSQVNANVYGRDIPEALLGVLDPLTLELGNLSTTAIGSLQSGNMTATFDSSDLLARASSTAEGSTTGATMLAEQYGAFALPIAMQNVSVNTGAIDGSVNLALNDVNAKTGTIATTAIGSLGSGAMTATITGAMGAPSSVGTGLVNALVGTTTTTTTTTPSGL